MSELSAAAVLWRGRRRLVVDQHELLRRRLLFLAGVQRLCVAGTDAAAAAVVAARRRRLVTKRDDAQRMLQTLESAGLFLRSLDAAGLLSPQRSDGGHRRYSRRQLELAARVRALFDEGMTLDAAARIVGLQDELDAARARISALEADEPGSSDDSPR